MSFLATTVGVQLLPVPQRVLKMATNGGDDGGPCAVVDAYPILNVYPARRMFHEPIEITLPVRDPKAAKEKWKDCSPRLGRI